MARHRQTSRHYPRVARVNEVVLECLADELERLSDPRLGFVTITDVEVSADLRIADVYYSVMGQPEQHKETATALVSAAPHLRAVLGRQVRLKFVPELRFREDAGLAAGQRIEAILRDLHASDDPAEERGTHDDGSER
jgi:ribosome-binding factor A